MFGFQSTLPRGSDICTRHTSLDNQISIHAPSRERHGCICYHRQDLYFNPRSLAGATRLEYDDDLDELISIHAPSRERLTSPLSWTPKHNFNPRSLAGATLQACVGRLDAKISIHAPSRERRQGEQKQASINQFQSTLPRGSDNQARSSGRTPCDFNPRSLAGATR